MRISMNKIYIVTIDEEFEKARTLGATDTKPRKKRKLWHPKPFPFKNKNIQVHTIFHEPTVPQTPIKSIVRYGTLMPVTRIRPTWTGD